MSCSWISIISLLAIATSSAAETAAPPAAPPTVPGVFARNERLDRDDTPQSIEALRNQLQKKSRSKTAKKVSRAIIALKEKKFALARDLVRPLKNDELFSDYFYGIQASSYFQEAAAALIAGQGESAIRNAKKAIDLEWDIESRFPYSPFLKKLPETLSLSELTLADAYAARGDAGQAQGFYERAFQRLSHAGNIGLIHPESLGHYAATCQKRAGLLCRSWIQRFAQLNTRTSEEGRAIAKFFPDAFERTRPPGVTRQTQTYKGTDLDQVAFDAAMALYSDSKYGAAIKAFYRFLDEYPRSSHRFRARYWMGQALSQEQQHEKAQRTYEELTRESPLSYYGLLAAIASGKNVESEIAGTLPQALNTDPFLLPQEVLRLRRAERFLAEGAPTMAQQELRELKARDALSGPFLIYLSTLQSEAGNHNSAFSILGDLIQRSYPGVFSSYIVRLIFPVAFYDTIQKTAAQLKMDPILVLSLIKQESAFDDDAASGVGASGLMQLMPATAVETEPGVKRADLQNAEVNIRVGTKYLRRMLDKYNGNIAFSLAAYNAGPGAVDRWIRDGRSKKGLLDFIEQIPYKETREYVGSIIRNYFWYSRRLSGEPPKGMAYFWNMYGPPEPAPPTAPSQATVPQTTAPQAVAPATTGVAGTAGPPAPPAPTAPEAASPPTAPVPATE